MGLRLINTEHQKHRTSETQNIRNTARQKHSALEKLSRSLVRLAFRQGPSM